MRKDEGRDDPLSGEVMNAENEANFFLERHAPVPEQFGRYYADLDGVKGSQRYSVEERGRHERLIGEVLIGVLFLFRSDHQTRNEYDRQYPEYRLDGRRYRRAEVSEALEQVKREEDDRDAKRRFHRYRERNVGLRYGRGVEIGHR